MIKDILFYPFRKKAHKALVMGEEKNKSVGKAGF